jgi:uncharacterized protein (TIGR02453 family)
MYFTPEFINFFIELAANNHRDWFAANKKRYETHVKQPFAKFFEDLLQAVREKDPNVVLPPNLLIYRINRDIRFSQDKSPYKLHTSALISPAVNKQDMQTPGLYFEFGPEFISFFGGVYMPEKENLERIRTYMTHDPETLTHLLAEKEFTEMFGGVLKGAKNKRLPKEFQETEKVQPYIANKQFYYEAHFPAELMLKEDILDFVLHAWEVVKPVNDWFEKAMK